MPFCVHSAGIVVAEMVCCSIAIEGMPCLGDPTRAFVANRLHVVDNAITRLERVWPTFIPFLKSCTVVLPADRCTSEEALALLLASHPEGLSTVLAGINRHLHAVQGDLEEAQADFAGRIAASEAGCNAHLAAVQANCTARLVAAEDRITAAEARVIAAEAHVAAANEVSYFAIHKNVSVCKTFVSRVLLCLQCTNAHSIMCAYHAGGAEASERMQPYRNLCGVVVRSDSGNDGMVPYSRPPGLSGKIIYCAVDAGCL